MSDFGEVIGALSEFKKSSEKRFDRIEARFDRLEERFHERSRVAEFFRGKISGGLALMVALGSIVVHFVKG